MPAGGLVSSVVLDSLSAPQGGLACPPFPRLFGIAIASDHDTIGSSTSSLHQFMFRILTSQYDYQRASGLLILIRGSGPGLAFPARPSESQARIQIYFISGLCAYVAPAILGSKFYFISPRACEPPRAWPTHPHPGPPPPASKWAPDCQLTRTGSELSAPALIREGRWRLSANRKPAPRNATGWLRAISVGL